VERAEHEYKYLDLILADGARARYLRTSPGAGRTGAVLLHTASPSRSYMSRLTWNGAGWDLDLTDGSRYSFPHCPGAVRPEQCGLSGYRDGQGRELTLTRDSSGNLLRVSAGWFRKIDFRYDSAHRIVRAETGPGLSTTTVRYAYDEGGTCQ
jgi:YD repeat-containing protein